MGALKKVLPVALPALATTVYTAKQPKERTTDVSKWSSKRESDNKPKRKQDEGGVRETEQIQGGKWGSRVVSLGLSCQVENIGVKTEKKCWWNYWLVCREKRASSDLCGDLVPFFLHCGSVICVLQTLKGQFSCDESEKRLQAWKQGRPL